jgi:hypothetical protein
MQKEIKGGPLTLDPRISESFHIMPKCVDIVITNRRLSVARYQKLKEHYEQCIHCQVMIGVFLRTTQREEQIPIDTTIAERRHLQRLVHMLHSIVREDIAVYIDVLEELGVTEASERFPAFAEHVDSCRECQCSVEETRKWLQAEQGE